MTTISTPMARIMPLRSGISLEPVFARTRLTNTLLMTPMMAIDNAITIAAYGQNSRRGSRPEKSVRRLNASVRNGIDTPRMKNEFHHD
jgi:hypothetical protein